MREWQLSEDVKEHMLLQLSLFRNECTTTDVNSKITIQKFLFIDSEGIKFFLMRVTSTSLILIVFAFLL